MPRPGMLWRHVVINTHGSWLHGDARGFRSRRHRIHSSGDYRNPPPPGEHKRLFEYHKQHCPREVTFDRHLRPQIGRGIVEFLLAEKYRLLCVAVGKVHAHFVVELPADLKKVKRIVGECKRYASARVGDALPGTVWSAGGKFVLVKDKDHLKSACDYDLYDQGIHAWTWSYRDGSKEGLFGRTRPTESSPRGKTAAARRK